MQKVSDSVNFIKIKTKSISKHDSLIIYYLPTFIQQFALEIID